MAERLPDWLSSPTPVSPRLSDEGKALLFQQFETVFPRVLELMSSGSTLAAALREIPIPIDSGAFMRWIRKDPQRSELYKEAKEIRTEAWAGEIIRHAVGTDTDVDVSRSRLVVDTYKWLMGADNRKQYGDTKTIEMNTNISITAALAQAQARVIDVAATEVIDEREVEQYRALPSAEVVDEWEDSEDD